MLSAHILWYVACTFSYESCSFCHLWIAKQNFIECRMSRSQAPACLSSTFSLFYDSAAVLWLWRVASSKMHWWYRNWDQRKGSRFIHLLVVWSLDHVSRMNVQNRHMVCPALEFINVEKNDTENDQEQGFRNVTGSDAFIKKYNWI